MDRPRGVSSPCTGQGFMWVLQLKASHQSREQLQPEPRDLRTGRDFIARPLIYPLCSQTGDPMDSEPGVCVQIKGQRV